MNLFISNVPILEGEIEALLDDISRAVVGDVLDIGPGWIVTPLAAGILSWIPLFFMQNLFLQTVYN